MKIRIRYILDIIAMALAIWALMAMMPSEAKTAAETPHSLGHSGTRSRGQSRR